MYISHHHVDPSHALQSPVSEEKKSGKGWQAWRDTSTQDIRPRNGFLHSWGCTKILCLPCGQGREVLEPGGHTIYVPPSSSCEPSSPAAWSLLSPHQPIPLTLSGRSYGRERAGDGVKHHLERLISIFSVQLAGQGMAHPGQKSPAWEKANGSPGVMNISA